MSSARDLANRNNAQHSTGPNTPEGKQASKYNATRHGLSGKQVIVYGEDPAAFERLHQELIASYNPANAAESTLVEEIAQNFWRLQRARRIEAETFNIHSGGADPVITYGCAIDRFEQIRRYMTSIERAYHRAIVQLEKTQSIRVKSSAPAKPSTAKPAVRKPGIGFVSQMPKPELLPSLPKPEIQPLSITQRHRGPRDASRIHTSN
jgi:hypothetical protein